MEKSEEYFKILKHPSGRYSILWHFWLHGKKELRFLPTGTEALTEETKNILLQHGYQEKKEE